MSPNLKSFWLIFGKGITIFCLCFSAVWFSPSYAQDSDREHYNAGIIFALQGRFEKAEKEFQKGLESDNPFVTPLKAGLVIVKDVLDHKIKNETGIRIFKATDWANKGELNKAIDEFTAAVKLDPEYYVTYNARGSVYFIKGMDDKALADFNQSIRCNPSYPKAYLNRAGIYGIKGMVSEALADFNKALDLNPRYPEGFYNRGIFYSRNGEYENAVRDFSKAITLYSKYSSAYHSRAIAYGYLHKYHEALADLNTVIELNPGNILVYYDKGLVCEKLGEKKDAIEAYQKFIQSAPFRLMERVNEARNRIDALK